jgi:2-methylfumaryl-CoA isomerase
VSSLPNLIPDESESQSEPARRYAPLDGIRIVELSTYVAGPSCGLALAQLGADVIRVDPLGGATDLYRFPLAKNGDSLCWAGLNRAKRSVEIDTACEEGRELVYSLLSPEGLSGGVLLTNAVAQEWLQYEELARHCPGVIVVHITGHADGRPALDYTVNSEIGIPLITGSDELNRPVNQVVPAWDLMTGLYAAIAILSAERLRSRTGQGQVVEVALADVAVAAMSTLGFIGEVALNPDHRERDGNYLYGSFGSDFQSRDGRSVMIAAITERQWRNLIEMTKSHEIIAALEKTFGVDLAVETVRYRYREILAGVFRPWFESRDFAEIELDLDSHRVMWGPFRSLDELVSDPKSILNQSQIFEGGVHRDVGTYPVARSPLRFSEWSAETPQRFARFGEDTETTLLGLLGKSSSDVQDLRKRRIVGGLT